MSEIIDAAVLDDLIENIGAEGGRAVIELFIEECRELVAAVSPGEPEAARRAAHSLKSSAGQLGAAALADAARAVEQAAEARSPELAACVATLADCAVRTEAALAARLG